MIAEVYMAVGKVIRRFKVGADGDGWGIIFEGDALNAWVETSNTPGRTEGDETCESLLADCRR